MKASKLTREMAFFDKPCKISQRELKALYKIDPDKTYHYYFLMGKGVDFTAYNHMVVTKYGKLPAYYNFALRKISDSDYFKIIKL